jgi:hypothetical protein
MTRTTMKITVAAAAFAVLAGSAPASARQQVAAVTATTEAPPSDRAVELRNQAEELYAQPAKWRKAARLLEQSAQLRTGADTEAYTCLLIAGRLRAAAGDYYGARNALEKAAEHAAARGAVMDAAHAYIDAAIAAIEDSNKVIAQDLLGKAQLLAKSPLLTEEQVREIGLRIKA